MPLFPSQWFDDLHIYHVYNDEDFPNHELETSDDYVGEDDVPYGISFPPNSDNEVILKAEYYSGTDELMYSVAAAEPSGQSVDFLLTGKRNATLKAQSPPQ